MSNKSSYFFDISPLRCPYCRSSLKYLKKIGESAIVMCRNHKFPMVDGILYLKVDKFADTAIENITHGRIFPAYINLINLNRRLLLPFFLFKSKVKIPFNNFIKLAKRFGFDKNWSDYLLERTQSDSYKITANSIETFRKGDKILDFGCGVGQLLPLISKKTAPGNLYAIDNSFVNLAIAKKYFVKRHVLLICSDGELQFPFAKNFINNITATDSFHYIRNKKLFINESRRILKSGGGLMIFQTINAKGTVFGNIKAIQTENLSKMLKTGGFKRITIFSNQNKTIKHTDDKQPFNISAVK